MEPKDELRSKSQEEINGEALNAESSKKLIDPVTETQETEVVAVEAVQEVEATQAEEIVVVVEDVQTETTPEVVVVGEPEAETLDLEEEEHVDENVVLEGGENLPNYAAFSEFDLVNELRLLVANENMEEVANKIEFLKVSFYKKHKARQTEHKKAFLDAGGDEEQYRSEVDPYEMDIRNLLKEFKQRRAEVVKSQEAEKEDNLQIKYEIIDEIKNLVNRKESINKTFHEFRDLQQKWRETGLVPQSSMKDLWDTYHHHVENFYDYIKINKELRDLDLKKNLEHKIDLCEKAESLLLESSIVKAFNSLQKYHELWREIGPVPREKKDEIWERFKDVTTTINKKHQDFFESKKDTQKKNLDAKTAICEKVEEILGQELLAHKDWEDKSNDIVEFQKLWRTIGFAPRKENNEIYERFRSSCDRFFDLKRDFYSKHREEQSANLQKKLDLCEQAESLKESTEWKKTTEEFIAIQKQWKEVGPVPRKQSDQVWKRFRAACDLFFEQKSKFFNVKDQSEGDNLILKLALIDEVNSFVAAPDEKDNFERLKEMQRRWTDIGHVPIDQKNEVQKKFREAINKQFDILRIDDRDRNMNRFKSKVNDWSGSNKGSNKLRTERDKHVFKLKQLESDLTTLKNNIGFFANSKNAEALINDVKLKILNNEEQVEILKDKIRVIDELDNQED